MEVNLPMVQAAIERLFDPSAGTAASQQANRFLCQLQEIPQTWPLCWQLLDVHLEPKCHIVGAAMIHTRITQQLHLHHQVPPDELGRLRERLVAAIDAHATASIGSQHHQHHHGQVAVRLTVALAAFAALTMDAFWKSAVTDMTENFRESHPILLFEFLANLPDQVVRLEIPQKYSLTLSRSASVVLSLCHSALLSTVMPLRQAALRAVPAWAALAIIEDFPLNFINALLDLISDEPEQACEAVLSLAQHQDGSNQPKLMMTWLVQIVTKCVPVVQSKQAARDYDALFSIYSMLTGVADTHASLILKGLRDTETQAVMEMLVKMLLDCVGTPGVYPAEETLSRVALPFWHTLLDEHNRLLPAETAKTTINLQPVYEQLVRHLLNKSQLPDPDCLDSDEREELRCYRQDITDCYMCIMTVLPVQLIRFFMTELETAIARFPETNNSRIIEACLFAINSVGDVIDGDEDVGIVSAILEILPRVPPASDEIQSQVMTAVGTFADKTSTENIGPLVHILLGGLQRAGTSAAASMALKDVARAHGDRLEPAANDILQAIRVVLHVQTHLPLKHRDRQRLVSIVGHVASALSSTDQALTSLTALMAPFVLQMNEMVNCPEVNPSFSVLMKENLELLQSMFFSLSFAQGETSQQTSRPGQVLAEQLLPLFKQIATKYANSDCEVVSSLAECIRKMVPILEIDDQCVILLELLTICGGLLLQRPNAIVINTTTSIFAHTKADQTGPLGHQFKFICHVCFARFDQDFRESTELVEAFYRMHGTLLKKRLTYYEPSVLSPDDLIQLCKHATLGTMLPEHHTFKSCVYFLTQFVIATERSEFIKEALKVCAEGIVIQLIQNMCGNVSRQYITCQADIFLALSRSAPSLLTAALHRFARAPLERPTADSRQNFVRQILRERSNKRILINVVSDFTVEWRNLPGAYGRATANVNEI